MLSLILEKMEDVGEWPSSMRSQWKSWCMRETMRKWPCNVAPIRSNWLVKPYLYMQFITSHLTSVLQFCGKLTTLLEQDITYMHGRVLMVGNFNIHIDKKATSDNTTLNDILEGLNLRNNIEMEIHTSGHTLDLIIDDCKDSLVIATNKGHQILDHCFIHSTLHIKKLKLQIKITWYRKLKNMNSIVNSKRTSKAISQQ